jgi:hypothetical protein
LYSERVNSEYSDRLLGKAGEAAAIYKEAVAASDAGPANRPEELSQILFDYAYAIDTPASIEEALKLNERNLDLRLRTFGKDSNERAEALVQRGRLQTDAERYDDAIREFSSALDVYGSRTKGRDFALAENYLAGVLRLEGQVEQARERQLEALSILGKQSDTWEVATVLTGLARVSEAEGRYHESESYARQAVDIMAKYDDSGKAGLGTSIEQLADALRDEGRFADAVEQDAKAADLLAAVYGRESRAALSPIEDSGTAYLYWGHYAQAERTFRDALDRLDKRDKEQTAIYESNLSLWAEYTGHYQEAETLRASGLQAYKDLFGMNSPAYLEPYERLAGIYALQGRYREADRILDLSMNSVKSDPDKRKFAIALVHQATVRLGQGRGEEALQLAQQALGLAREFSTESEWRKGGYLVRVGTILTSLGRNGEAEKFYRETLDLWKGLGFPNHPDTAAAHIGLGLLAGSNGKYSQMQEECVAALNVAGQNLSPKHPAAAEADECLADYEESGAKNLSRALDRQSEAISILRDTVPGHPDIARALQRRADILDRLGRTADAESDRAQAKQVLDAYTRRESRTD